MDLSGADEICDGARCHDSDDTISEVEESLSLEKDIQQASAIWILKTRECNKLTQVTTENIIKDVDSLYQVALNNIQHAVKRALTNAGVQVPELDTILSSTGPYGKLFSGLETHHRQLMYTKSHFKLVVSV